MRDKYYYINRLPDLKLSYDTILHKKVYADLYALVPTGNRVLAWFTYDNNKNVCLIMYLNKYNNITNIEYATVCYDKVLSYGTIIYGIYFKYQDMNYLTCQDIYYFKGIDVQNSEFKDKIKMFNDIFKNYLQQKAYNNNFVIFGLPYINNNLHNLFNKIKEIPYSISHIVFYKLNEPKNIGILNNRQPNNAENIFKIKADIEQDIYSLYCRGNKCDDFYGYAGIFDYKTSVMMNNYYRKIKENKNLDLLEMSDDEEEFENIKDDKYVNLKKILYMKCKYNKKFRKWEPLELVNFGEKLLTKREIQNLEYDKR
tara:strand:+ start:95 stop:1030 length:936 start_codon:yes stop_codon:yes gene_type:complete